MEDNGETAEQLQNGDNVSEPANKVTSLELLNGTELLSADEGPEGSDGDVVSSVKQEEDDRQVDISGTGSGDGKGDFENDFKTSEGKGKSPVRETGKSADVKNTDGGSNGKFVQYSKFGENREGLDIDKDVDESDKNTLRLEGDISQSEMVVDSFPEPQQVQNSDEKDVNIEPLDNSMLSNCTVEDEDGYTTTDTDTSQIARDLVQQALDQAILTFHNESSSVPSLSSTQELNVEDTSHDVENVIDSENKGQDLGNLETQDSVEEVETEVTFESVKKDLNFNLNDSQDISYDNDDLQKHFSDIEVVADGGQILENNFVPQQKFEEHERSNLLTSETVLTQEITSDRGEDSDVSDTEFGGLAKLDPLPQYPDFPENYGNYKVCRSLEPGVKECIILETGECVRCRKSYSGICKTGKCTAVNRKEEILPESESIIPNQEDHNEQIINNESKSPNVSLSSVSSDESGKQNSFRIIKSPTKDGGTAYLTARSVDEISQIRQICDLSSNVMHKKDETHFSNDEKLTNGDQNLASLANENERQFAYLDNLRSSRQDEPVLNNHSVQRTSSNVQKPPADVSYSQLSANQEFATYPSPSQSRQQARQPELSYNRLSSSEAHIPQSYSSTSHYSKKYESSPLSDPSVLVRYQRNLISRDFPAERSGDTYSNFIQSSPGSDSARINSQRKVEERKLDLTKDQYDLNQSERELLAEIYAKYGRPTEQIPDSFVSSVSGDYSRNRSTQELLSSSTSSGHIPSYKTLQEQQASWMSMFQTLEKEHQDELRHQYQRHQQAIFNLQQQVERDIHIQEQSFRKKLNAHKEMLVENSSPSRVTLDGEIQNSRVTDNSFQDFENVEECKRQEIDRTHNSLYDGQRSLPTRRETSPPWREIYREIRESIDDIESVEGSENSGPVRRSLEKEFSSPSQHMSRLQAHSKGQTSSRSPRSPRDKGSGRKPELNPDGFPRAGVYSSPMPILRNKGKKSTPLGTDADCLNNSLRVASPSLSEQHHSFVLKHDLESRHQERLQHQEERDNELMGNSTTSDDVYLSSSTRMNLREKHAKHLSDLREYYEKELSELRSAISASENIMNQNPYKRVTSENQNLHVENRLLKEKVAELEDDLDSSKRTIRELEQKVHGLEVRASDYADHLNESQSKLSTFRSKMEEMQYQSREREQLLKELNAKIKYQEEALKNSKKQKSDKEVLQEEQADIIVKDQSSVQKMINKYTAVERDHNILKETLNSTENKLYDARKEVVELNRTVAKLELENKRLGRENDNLRHKHSQSTHMNLSSIQGSFHEAFSSPEEVLNTSISPCRDVSNSRLLNGSYHKPNDVELPSTPRRINGSQMTADNSLPKDEDLVASPIMKAEQDVYKLRNMMLSCAPDQNNPPEPKLQKKYYGSEIKSNISSKNSDSFYTYGSPRMKREKSPSSINSRSTKSKSNKYLKSADPSVTSPSQSTPKRSQRPSARFNVEPDEFSSPTRFDVSSNGTRSRSGSSQRQAGDGQPDKDKRSPKSKATSTRLSKERTGHSGSNKEDLQQNQQNDKGVQLSVEETLNRVRSGVYVARPEWEDVYTSMVQPKKNNIETTSSSATREDRMKTIGDMEHRYDDLQTEKRKLESALSKVSSHGKGRIKKEQLENKLDNVEKELGSVRMSLKRWNILKTSS